MEENIKYHVPSVSFKVRQCLVQGRAKDEVGCPPHPCIWLTNIKTWIIFEEIIHSICGMKRYPKNEIIHSICASAQLFRFWPITEQPTSEFPREVDVIELGGTRRRSRINMVTGIPLVHVIVSNNVSNEEENLVEDRSQDLAMFHRIRWMTSTV